MLSLCMYDNEIQLHNDLTITDYDTIYGDYFNEMKLDDFLKKLNKEIKRDNDNYYVGYEKDNNQFFVMLNGKKSMLNINKKVMEDYAFGKCNHVTYILNELYQNKEQNDKLELIKTEELEKAEKSFERKVNRIENSNELPSLADAPMYVEYLEASNKEKLKEILKRTSCLSCIPLGLLGFAAGLGIPLSGDLVYAISALSAMFSGTGLAWFTHRHIDEKGRFYFNHLLKNESIRSMINQRKINKHRIKQIKSMQNYDRIVLPNSYSIDEFDKTIEEPIKQDLLTFKDIIINDVNKIVDRIAFINAEDREPLLEEARSIIIEYNNRYNAIQSNDLQNLSDLEADTELNLKMDMMKKISALEMKLTEIRNKDVKVESVESEKEKIIKKIDRLDNETKELNKLQRKR